MFYINLFKKKANLSKSHSFTKKRFIFAPRLGRALGTTKFPRRKEMIGECQRCISIKQCATRPRHGQRISNAQWKRYSRTVAFDFSNPYAFPNLNRPPFCLRSIARYHRHQCPSPFFKMELFTLLLWLRQN